jgi:AcrR family transcriptional regulator
MEDKKMADQGISPTATLEETRIAAETEHDDRPMRADARRNYERLVLAAKQVFTKQGGGASMEAIAREAGVGVGTLYRHFPKRIDVVEAVYRTDVDELIVAADTAISDLEPWDALVSWLRAFVKYAQGKRTFLNELHEAFEKNPQLKSSARERIESSMEAVLGRAQSAGVVRMDIDGADLTQIMSSMCVNATLSEGQGDRLLKLILDGLRQPADDD